MEKSTSGNENRNQDLDLIGLFQLIGKGFDKIGYKIYSTIKFLLKNIFYILGIVVIGAIIGYLLDQNSTPRYKHEVVVVPNFGSVTYLYNEIDQFKSNNSPIKSVKIEPIVNIYEFSKERWSNIELMKILEQQDIKINKFDEKSNVEKFYRYHLLTIYSEEKDSLGSIINSILNKINSNPYYLERQKIEKENLALQIVETTKTIESINQILNSLGTAEKSSSGVNVSSYPEIHQLINTKKTIFEDLNNLKTFQIENSQIIYETSKIVNVEEKGFSKMILLPIVLLVFAFIIYKIFSLYKKYNKTII
jgi:hypothetical protein